MVSIKKKVRSSLLLIPLCLTLYSCNESEFYEKEYLDDGTIGKRIKTDGGGTVHIPSGPKTEEPPVVVTQPPVKTEEPPVVVTQPPVKTEEPPVVVTQPPVKTEEPPVIVTQPPVKTEEPPVVVTQPPVKTEEPPVIVVQPPVKTEDPTLNLQDVKNYFTQNKSKNSKVDILWVIDDSGSMGDEQKALAYNFDIFIHEFIEKKVDFQMAITTTDATNGTTRRRSRGGKTSYYKSPARNGRMIGNSDDLNSAAVAKNESKFYKDFARYINVGTRGSGREKGLHTSLSFLKRYGDSFFRKDAYTIIVYVSDEEDQSSEKAQDYVKAYQATKSNAGMVKIYSIVTKKKTRRWESVGSRYMAASEMTGGTSAHIKGDFYTILRDMGGKIVDLMDSFALSQQPYADKVSVLVAGQKADVITYDYDKVSRTVKFKKGFLPSEGANITVSYQVEANKNSVLLGSN